MKYVYMLCVIAGFVAAIVLLERRVQTRFHYRFFTWKKYYLFIAGVLAAYAAIYLASRASDERTYVAVVGLVAISGVLLWWVLFQNVTKTNLVYGLIGSLFQLSTLSVLAYAGIFAGLVVACFIIMPLAVLQPVYVVNRGKK